MGRIVNQRELAEVLDYSAKSISLWQRDGLPVLLETETGLDNQYDIAAVHRWLMAREIARKVGESEKDRLNRLQGDKLELEIAEKRALLIPTSEIEPAWVAMVLAAREALLSMPARVASIVVQMDGADQVRDFLEMEMEEALKKLATRDDYPSEQPDAPRSRRLGTADTDAAGEMGGDLSGTAVRVGDAWPVQPGDHALPAGNSPGLR